MCFSVVDFIGFHERRSTSTAFNPPNIQTDLTPQQRKALARQLSAMKMEWKEKRAK